MKTIRIYEPDDKLIVVIRDNYDILQVLGAFGISLGFGDMTVGEVCRQQGVDAFTFLRVVNFLNGGPVGDDADGRTSVPTLLRYLQASHAYYLDFMLPFLRSELSDALDSSNALSPHVMKLYDSYADSIRQHMQQEERTLFPYVEGLLRGESRSGYALDTYPRSHTLIDQKLKELGDIIIRYLPSDGLRNNQLTHTLYDLLDCQSWLQQHSRVEEAIFLPAIRRLAASLPANDDDKTADTAQEALSEREKEVVAEVARGYSNKQIADHLCLSVNTVLTHRRNIARKLQIHTPAGLTIYALANHLIDLDSQV